jgi:hypothetical protein
MPMDQQSVMNSLRNEPPEAWLAYLRDLERGDPGEELSMQVIYHFAAPRARRELSLDWAEVAIRAAEREARNSSGIERENALTWAMNLRSWFISKMGSQPSNVVLDKHIIMDWIMDGLRVPLQAVKEKASSLWESVARAKDSSSPNDLRQSASDFSQLRNIKRRLNVAKTLADCGQLPSDSALNAWLEIREQLP